MTNKEKLQNIKVRVPTPDISAKVQEILFKNGFEWPSGLEVRHLDMPYLFSIGECIAYSNKEMEFFERKAKELTYQEILDMDKSKETGLTFKEAYEIHKATGRKIKREGWKTFFSYIAGELRVLVSDATSSDWMVEPLKEEPKKVKKSVTLYRHLYRDLSKDTRSSKMLSEWNEDKDFDFAPNRLVKILKTESKVVEYEEEG